MRTRLFLACALVAAGSRAGRDADGGAATRDLSVVDLATGNDLTIAGGGCSCEVGGRRDGSDWLALACVVAVFFVRRRRAIQYSR